MSIEICISVGIMGICRYLEVTTGVCRNLQLSGGIYTFHRTTPFCRSESVGVCNSLWGVSRSVKVSVDVCVCDYR